MMQKNEKVIADPVGTCVLKENKLKNERIRELAAKHSYIPLKREQLERILFYVATMASDNCYFPLSEIPEYDDWEYTEFLEELPSSNLGSGKE